MKIALVLDQYDSRNNGTTISAARFADGLRERGHEVVIVSTGKQAPGKFAVPSAHMLIFEPLVRSQGMTFAKPDDEVIRLALEGVDVAHLYLPYKLCMRTRQIAKEMNVPYMAAFHCQPENVSYSLGLKHFKPFSRLLYYWFKRRFYRHVDDIHCPSAFIADQLKQNGYKAKMHVISNGVDKAFKPLDIEKPKEYKDKFVIMMVGRLSEEKRQDLVIKAANHSKYADIIQLVFLGQGPKRKRYEQLGRSLLNKPVFSYVSKEELTKLYNQCDLYVHSAEAEIEAIVCIEAIACGCVPVIANAQMSAAKQFALDDRSLFKNKDYRDLAKKIDYWIEHPEEKQKMKQCYISSARNYTLEKSIDSIEKVYKNVIARQKKRKASEDDPNRHIVHMPTPFNYKVDKNYRFVNQNAFFRLASSFVFYVIAIPFLTVVSRLFFGLKITGKKNFRFLKGGAVTVTNHVHYLDSPMVACTLFPRRPFFATLKSNFEIPVIRRLVRLLGGVPIPESPKALHAFMESMRRELVKGRIVHFYPEASLWPWADNIRPFKNGAFHLAVKSNVPVVPMVFTFRDAKWPVSIWRKKPLITMKIGEPEYPIEQGTDKQRIAEIKNAVQYAMESMAGHKPAS